MCKSKCEWSLLVRLYQHQLNLENSQTQFKYTDDISGERTHSGDSPHHIHTVHNFDSLLTTIMIYGGKEKRIWGTLEWVTESVVLRFRLYDNNLATLLC